MYEADTSTDEGVKTTIQQRWEQSQSHHQYFINLYEKRERAYRGVKDRAQREKWQHNLRPPYAFNLLETVVASQIEMGLRYDVRPSPHSADTQDQAKVMLAAASDVSDLIRHEYRVDEMDSKQRPLYLCDGIGGVGVGKTYWNYTPGVRKRQGVVHTPIYGPHGEVLSIMPQIQEIEDKGALRDHSTTEIVDPRDFVWHESSRSLDPRKPGGAQYVTHRCWYSFEQLKELERIGVVSGVDALKESRDHSGEYRDRETELFNVNRAKDLIEVLEHWWYEGGKIYYAWLANKEVLLVPKTENPFWHDQYPFFIVSSMPQPFSLHGTSTIELIQDLQEILHELQNQRLDSVELTNNAIMLIRGDVDDPDAWEHYPGARWEVDDVSQVEPLKIDHQIGEISIKSEEFIKQDLQTVTSASPFAGGTGSGVQGTTSTATGASIVMNAAQQQLAMRKWTAQLGLQQEANMRLKNCQEFYEGTKLVHILGPGGSMAFKEINVLSIQGDYIIELHPMSESQMRQEKRAEANTVLQQMQALFPSSYAAGYPIDMHQVVLWWAKQWDLEEEVNAFFEPQQTPDPSMVNMLFGKGPQVQIRATTDPQEAAQIASGAGYGNQQQPPGAQPATPPGGGQNMGTTAATAVDAASPSATGGLSMSGAQFLARAKSLATSRKR